MQKLDIDLSNWSLGELQDLLVQKQLQIKASASRIRQEYRDRLEIQVQKDLGIKLATLVLATKNKKQ